VWRTQGCDIVRFTIVVPGDNLNIARSQSEQFCPAIEPQSVTWKEPVLAVRNFGTIMGEKPRRRRGHIVLAIQRGDVVLIASVDSAGLTGSRCTVLAIVGPSHPVEGTIKRREVRSEVRAEVGHEFD
jgi:hypothetical protein